HSRRSVHVLAQCRQQAPANLREITRIAQDTVSTLTGGDITGDSSRAPQQSAWANCGVGLRHRSLDEQRSTSRVNRRINVRLSLSVQDPTGQLMAVLHQLLQGGIQRCENSTLRWPEFRQILRLRRLVDVPLPCNASTGKR